MLPFSFRLPAADGRPRDAVTTPKDCYSTPGDLKCLPVLSAAVAGNTPRRNHPRHAIPHRQVHVGKRRALPHAGRRRDRDADMVAHPLGHHPAQKPRAIGFHHGRSAGGHPDPSLISRGTRDRPRGADPDRTIPGSGRSRRPMRPSAKEEAGKTRPGCACVWVKAPSAGAAVEMAGKRLGHMGAWTTGPNVEQEVFRAEEYRDHAQAGDNTRSVILDRQPS